ncbi:MAG: DMT family transporter [Bacteroidales bacterium]|jgi:drug/metabolite transporter (DMT)-like permease|nr:DMT family transporter [Bacteroidales bacterium]
MGNRTQAHLALLISSLIFGLNYSISKSLLPVYINPLQLVFLRLAGSIAALVLISLFYKGGKIEKKDYPRVALAGFLGITINQLFFFEGLSRTSAVETSIIHTSSPIIVLLFAFFIIGEKINLRKMIGILLGLGGALLLILQGKEISWQSDHFTGDLMILINVSAYSMYLVIVKPLMTKYSPLSVMKWVFICGFGFVMPFSIPQLKDIPFSSYDISSWSALLYVVFITTTLGFTLTVFALRHVSAGVTAYYMYLQPLIAGSVAIIWGTEKLGAQMLIATALIFSGVYVITRKKEDKLKASDGKERSTIRRIFRWPGGFSSEHN